MLLESESHIRFLNEELARRMRVNPRYSLRSFARQLGVSPGELSELLRGKRKLSFKLAVKIAIKLDLSMDEKNHLLSLVQGEEQLLHGQVPALALSSRQLTLDMFHVVSDWFCFAILTLADCIDFKWDTTWIARRLAISETEVRIALERLERVGLIERKGKSFVAVKDYVMTPSGIPSEAIRNYHRTLLSKAIEALELQSVFERDISGISLALDPAQLPALKKEISDFQDRIVQRYSQGKKRGEVYQLEVACFRLTQGEDNGKK
ncbi:MAG: TIGR02147 family protein [Deltaproteobacteria bacterium]|nr:TIGR02147 family protein [Deltaproteobacteria bacterium]